jgi:hypothetical protein
MSLPHQVAEYRSLDDLYYQRKDAIVNGINLGRERYSLYEGELDPHWGYFDNLRGTHDKSSLNIAFFSQQNMDIIQNLIRKEIYRRSQGRYNIGNQDYTQLLLIMRSIYLQNSQFGTTNIKGQIDNLNKLVVYESVPRIITEIEQYLGYVRDASRPWQPIDRSSNVNNAGTRQLRSVTSIFDYR